MLGQTKRQDAVGCACGTMDSRLRGNDDDNSLLLRLFDDPAAIEAAAKRAERAPGEGHT
jgi:hypothetical protein